MKRDCPVTSIQHGKQRNHRELPAFGENKQISGDYLVCCMSAVMLRRIPITPALPDKYRWAIGNVPYYSATRPVLQSRTKFWRDKALA